MSKGFWIDEDCETTHKKLSESSWRFLEFVKDNPECLSRDYFSELGKRSEFVRYPLQSWPVIMDASRAAEMKRANRELCRLIRSIPQRVLGNDATRIAETYGIDSSDCYLIMAVLENPRWVGRTLGRGDFIQSRSGFKCIEVNMTSSLGGWNSSHIASAYRTVPVLQRFFESLGRPVSYTNSAQALFEQVIEDARVDSVADGSEINVVFAVSAENRGSESWYRYAKGEYVRILRDVYGATGELMTCSYPELIESGGVLYHRSKPVHAVIESYQGLISSDVYRAWMAGRINVYNGPLTVVLSDKLNLALLSENEESDVFDEEERRIIREHIPWARSLTTGKTTFRGERIDLSDFVMAEREKLVLKPRREFGGLGVTLGRETAPELWAETIRRASREGGWLVQERVESEPFLFQSGQHGCEPFNLVWGFLIFGEKDGGSFVRMKPRSATDFVINTALGAIESIIFEVGT